MIIQYIMGGIGNQLSQYAAARRLAHKLGVELKLDISWYVDNRQRQFELDKFNTHFSIASPEEINNLRELNRHREKPIGIEPQPAYFMPEVLDYPDNVWLWGYYADPRYFLDSEDIIREDLTLKTPPRGAGAAWLEKINAADCPVSLHVRHGDYATRMNTRESGGLIPIDYYRDCVERLKQIEPRITLFVFSNGMDWAKENINFGVPTEFVEGCERDVDELFLMSECRHNIVANSTFSWWSAFLNRNPDKKIFRPHPWFRKSDPNKPDGIPESWIKVPVDFDKNPPTVKLPPIFSIVLVTHNDENFIAGCLTNLLSQDYLYYEIVVVDDASTDRTFDICQQAAAQSDKIVTMRFESAIGIGAARNLAIRKARGEYIIFASPQNLIFSNVLTEFFDVNVEKKSDVFHSTKYLSVDPNGSVTLFNRKFRVNDDAAFSQMKYLFNINGVDAGTRLNLLAGGGMSDLLGSYLFRRDFLLDNEIVFDQSLERGTDVLFLIKCFIRAKYFWLTPVPSHAKAATPPPSHMFKHWDWELETFIRRLKESLQPIADADARDRLAIGFVRKYLNAL